MRDSGTSDPATRTRTKDGEATDQRTTRAGESWAPSDEDTILTDSESRAAAARISIIDVKLVGPHAAPDTDAAPDTLPGAAPAALGTLVRGRYELEEVLGTGSMGTVYRAKDHLHEEMKDANPFVAIKLLNDEFKRHPKALMSLQRETRRAQTLAHENIVAVHNFDRDGHLVFMTMELLDGKSLREIVAENASEGLPGSAVVPMIRGIAKALAYAHENEIVHCDLKPGNVFYTARGQIKVLDFGVARAKPRRHADGSERSVDEGEIVGMTPAYASPQMLAGEHPSPSDDVFSLAILCHELLTGRHPFDQQPVEAARLSQLRSRHPAGLSRSQRRALARALADDRDVRHEDAGEFLADFEGPSRLKSVAYGSATAALLLPVSTFFLLTQGVPPVVDVAFEDLPPEVQGQFNDAVSEGETALGFGTAGVNDALQYFSRAYDLHPGNERAVRGLETVADRLIAFIPATDAANQRRALTALYCHDYLGRYPPVAATCNQVLGAEQCAAIASTCERSPR